MKFLQKKYFSSNVNNVAVKPEEPPKISYTLGKNLLKNMNFI